MRLILFFGISLERAEYPSFKVSRVLENVFFLRTDFLPEVHIKENAAKNSYMYKHYMDQVRAFLSLLFNIID